MVLVCHVISGDHVIKGSCGLIRGAPLGSADVMFLVVEGQNSTCPRIDPPLLFISKTHDMPCSDTRNFRT